MALQEKTFRYRQACIHYRVCGYGVPVVLLHGFGEDGHIWDTLISYLEPSYHLIIPDLPGSGQSEIMMDEEADMELYAECIRRLLDEENVSHCIMIGHSMGGYITLAYHALYRESLLAWGLFHSSAYADSDEKKETRKKAIDFILQNGAGAFLKTSIPGLFADQSESNPWIMNLVEKGKAFKPEALVQYYRAMISRPDRTHELEASEVPVLLVLGEYDAAVPFAMGLEQCHLPNRSFVHVLRKTAHMGMLEEKENAGQILAYFLQNQAMFNR